jgi:hypothetical protein|tara:strand:+ start:484 stop:723 length:240 start_codon:yes stop_codon:yes gene_type:complete
MDLEHLIKDVKNLGPLDTVLLGASLLALFLLISAKGQEFHNLIGLLFNLEWYWYAGFLVIAAIRPIMHLRKMHRMEKNK